MEPFDTIDHIRDKSGPTEKDIQELRSLTLNYPRHPELGVCLGDMMQLSSSDYPIEESLRCYHQAIACDPAHADAYEELAWAYDTYTEDFENAERYFRLAIEKGGGDSCRVGLARVYAQLSKNNAALLELDCCKDQNHPDVVSMRSEVSQGIWSPRDSEEK